MSLCVSIPMTDLKQRVRKRLEEKKKYKSWGKPEERKIKIAFIKTIEDAVEKHKDSEITSSLVDDFQKSAIDALTRRFDFA